MPRLIPLFLILALSLPAQFNQGDWKTDVSKKSIDLKELLSGGPPKDGIPAIRQSNLVSVEDAAGWLSPDEPVLAVEHAGQARAYPFQILIWHELANDVIGDLPVLASYCPLCNSAIAFDRRVDGEAHEFGVSGMLRNSDMVMFDRTTDTLWQQLTGEAIVGTHTGKRLKIIPSQVVGFGRFRENFPEGMVLSRQTGHRRNYGSTPYAGYEASGRTIFPVGLKRRLPFGLLERLVTIKVGEKARAHPLRRVIGSKVVEGRLNKRRYVIFSDPAVLSSMDAREIAKSKAVGSVGVFSPEIDGQSLSFRHRKGKIVDEQTGSSWNVMGAAVEGPMAGKKLEPIEHGVYYAFAWLAFHPDTEIVGAGSEALPR